MTKPKTADQWLDCDDLPTKLAMVLTPGPWEHHWGDGGRCFKCRAGNAAGVADEPCPVPDPITIDDSNIAMKWRDKIMAGKDSAEFATLLLEVFGGGVEGDIDECFAKATARDYLIADAMMMERNKE